MNLLDRHNIFELIGSDRRKYHSALVTCYSYDFAFFEEQALPALRRANIKNVNVFADGRYLEQLLEHTTGKEFRPGKSYTLTPVYNKSVFHPKIMLLIGVEQALLVVGSGNLTGSGICSNDEIWGAFHIHKTDCQHSQLLSQAWFYFQQLRLHCHGFVEEAFEWIETYSPWINDIQHTSTWCHVSDMENVTLLYNKPGAGMLQQLSDLLPKDRPTAITVAAPFYDKRGELLVALKEHCKPSIMHAIVHAELGSIPEELPEKHQDIKFYEWQQVVKDANRLHAKLFHFVYADGQQYLLFGSANASVAAFGRFAGEAANDEACLLLHCKKGDSYLAQLGINLPAESVRLSDIEAFTFPATTTDLGLNFHLSYAELIANKLHLCFTKPINEAVQVLLLDKSDLELERLPITLTGTETDIVISCSTDCFKVAISINGKRASNYQLVHRVEHLLRNNPDPRQEKLEYLMEKLGSGEIEDVSKLLAHLSHNWADEDEVAVGRNGDGAAVGTQETETNDVLTAHERLPAQEFNEISPGMERRQAGILLSASVKVAEFLSGLSGSLPAMRNEDFDDSEETRQLEEGGQGSIDGKLTSSKKAKPSGRREQSAIWKYFYLLGNLYKKMLDPFNDSEGQKTPNVAVTIKSLSHMLIALEIFQLYYGRKFVIEEKDMHGHIQQYQESYIEEGLITDDQTAYWFVVDLMGRWVLLTQAGFHLYDYELIQHKQQDMRWQIAVKAIATVANLGWTDRLAVYRDTLMLNILQKINPYDIKEAGFTVKLTVQLQHVRQKWQKIHYQYDENINHLLKVLLPKLVTFNRAYVENRSVLLKSLATLTPGKVIYKSSMGFARFEHYRAMTGHNLLTLVSSGFPWDDDDERCQITENPNGVSVVVFS